MSEPPLKRARHAAAAATSVDVDVDVAEGLAIAGVPDDVLATIFSHLTDSSLFAVMLVCRRWSAVARKHVAVVRPPLSHCLKDAAREGHDGLIRYYTQEWGAGNVDEALYEAAAAGWRASMHVLKQCGAVDFDWALVGAVENDKLEVATLLCDWGLGDTDPAIDRAKSRGNYAMVKLLEDFSVHRYCDRFAHSLATREDLRQ